jgi:hypothetical protein
MHRRRVAEALEAEPDIDLVVFANAKVEVAREYETDVLADPRAEVFEALGTERTSPVSLLARSVGGGVRALREGMLPRATRADMLRLGADAAVTANGEVALLHRSTSADDRLAPEELIAALR